MDYREHLRVIPGQSMSSQRIIRYTPLAVSHTTDRVPTGPTRVTSYTGRGHVYVKHDIQLAMLC